MSTTANKYEDLASTARQIGDETKEAAKDLRSRVTPMLASARERATEVSQQLRDRAKDNAQAVDRYVHDNPWSFIGLGIVTGFLAGWYLLRRDR